MRIAFLGSSEFSKIVLQKLIESKHEVCCVVCNLDKESGRGHKVVFSPAKEFAIKNGIPVLQYKRVSQEGYDDIKSFNPDILITASFGQMLKENILNLAKYGVVNVHTSLLPKYRGSCPINWVLINGEKETGVTIMKTEIGLDTGDMILQEKVKIIEDETAGELTLRLANFGGDYLLKALLQIENGEAKYVKQDEGQSSYYPMLSKEMGLIDFEKSPKEIQNLCNGLNPWPVCFTLLNGETLKVYKAKEFDGKIENLSNFKNGQVVLSSPKKGLIVKCNDDKAVLLSVIQAQNGKMMESKSYLNGKSIPVGSILGDK